MSSFRQNWLYWVVALISAIALHAYVQVEEEPRTRTLPDVPLVFTNTGDLQVTPRRRTVSVTVQGPRDVIDRMSPRDVTASVDLRGLTPGSSYSLAIDCASKVAPDMVICTPNPAIVRVSVDATVSKLFQVVPRLVQAPPVGFEYTTPTVTPSEATATGVSRVLMRVERLIVLVRMGKEDIDAYFPIQAVDRRDAPVPGVRVDPPKAHVSATIRRALLSKMLLVTPVVSGRPEPGYVVTDLSVRPSMVKGRGGAILAETNVVHTVPIPLDGISENTNMKVSLERIPGIFLEPDTVAAHVEVKRVGQPAPPSHGGATGG